MHLSASEFLHQSEQAAGLALLFPLARHPWLLQYPAALQRLSLHSLGMDGQRL